MDRGERAVTGRARACRSSRGTPCVDALPRRHAAARGRVRALARGRVERRAAELGKLEHGREVVARDGEVLVHQADGLERSSGVAVRRAVHDHPAHGSEAREVALVGLCSAEHFEKDVDAPAAGGLADLRRVVAVAVVERVVRAERAHHRPLLFAARGAEHLRRAHRSRDLHGEHSDSARRSVNEDALSRSHATHERQAVVRGQSLHRQRRGALEVEPIGDGIELRRAREHLLCVRVAAEDHHAVSDAHVGHAFADRFDLARGLHPDDLRKARPHEILPHSKTCVGEVHPRRAHAHEDPPRRQRRVGDLVALENLGTAQRVKAYRAHRGRYGRSNARPARGRSRRVDGARSTRATANPFRGRPRARCGCAHRAAAGLLDLEQRWPQRRSRRPRQPRESPRILPESMPVLRDQPMVPGAAPRSTDPRLRRASARRR